MWTFVTFACCLAAVQARPGFSLDGYGGGGHQEIKLSSVPDGNSYSSIMYPTYQLTDLGTESLGSVPPNVVKILKTVSYKVPKPYTVKVPHPVPYPVPVDKPYPVQVPQFITVPQAIPVEVEKTVHVPVEVPKPYPVPAQEYTPPQAYGGQNFDFGGFGSGVGGSFDQSGHGAEQNLQFNAADAIQSGGYGGQDEGHADQSASYAAVAAANGQQEQQQYSAQEAPSASAPAEEMH